MPPPALSFTLFACHMLAPSSAFQSPHTSVVSQRLPGSSPQRNDRRNFEVTATTTARRDEFAISGSPFGSLFADVAPFGSLFADVASKEKSSSSMTAVERHFEAWNQRDIPTALDQFSEDCIVEDATFHAPFQGKVQLQRHLLLCSDAFPPSVKISLDGLAVSADGSKIGAKWHLEDDGRPIRNTRRNSFYTVEKDSGLIATGLHMLEPSFKPGKAALGILNAAGTFIDATGINTVKKHEQQFGKEVEGDVMEGVQGDGMSTNPGGWWDSLFGGPLAQDGPVLSAGERYFAAWNRRDMEEAVSLFSEDCEYDDTVFPEPFTGKQSLENHLVKVSNLFPPTFRFVVDDLADGGESLCIKWHVENGDEPLPFTRGVSFYTVEATSGLICSGIDEIEPVIKSGGIKIGLISLANKLQSEPIRGIPLALWATYMYVVFFSDGILPGANALQLEQRTWEEVRDLSLNFFLVSPILNLPFSPVVHPMLEGVFNLLLSWAAMFAGFLSDERENKPNSLPMLLTVLGMQFLTSAFLLPYLATRSSETPKNDGNALVVCEEDLSAPARVAGESRILGPFLGGIGVASIAWGLWARASDFGDLSARWTSFIDLLSIDRVGSSFIVDLIIFALFQGWLVDDDLRRRGVGVGKCVVLRNVAKFVPFFGMAFYLTVRPPLPSREEE